MNNIVIIAGARDYHAMDWYRTVRKFAVNRDVSVLTDLINSEGYDVIVRNNDHIDKLFVIDKLLFSTQSRVGNIWRNIIKIIVIPVQVLLLKRYSKKKENMIYHAQPMYYILLCWLAKVDYIGTPQGSEILVRAMKSRLYRYFAIKCMVAARCITVDSESMKIKIKQISNVDALVIQNGIDIEKLIKFEGRERNKITSIRGMTPLYRIKEIVSTRNKLIPHAHINFIYPFQEERYLEEVSSLLGTNDNNLGRLSKENMFKLLAESYLVISIPSSDSSPRSVYESIFMGCSVAVTSNQWIDILPSCMRSRIFIVDLTDGNWLLKAITFAKAQLDTKFVPSKEAIDMFDQNITMQHVIDTIYS